MKISRYPDEIADEIRGKSKHSFGASVLDNDFGNSSVRTPINNPTIVTLKDDLYLAKQSQFGATQDTIPSLSLQQRISHQIQNATTRRSNYEHFDETARNR